MSHHHKDYVGIKFAWIENPKLIKVSIDSHVHHDEIHVFDSDEQKILHHKRRDGDVLG